MAREAGADITEAVSRWDAWIPKEMKAPRTLPAMVAKPPVITAWISEMVSWFMYGRIRSGDSVCPTNMFPAATIDSAGDVPMVMCMINPTFRMSHCMKPR
uniref:Uncharacterized protein n=1 Tax=Anguilla anguilla TaxID=7936 RepID=A0A0E9QWR4_ANGAN